MKPKAARAVGRVLVVAALANGDRELAFDGGDLRGGGERDLDGGDGSAGRDGGGGPVCTPLANPTLPRSPSRRRRRKEASMPFARPSPAAARLLAVAVGLGLAVACPRAHGDERGDRVTQARAVFRDAVRAYDAARYQEALRAFQQAHALSHNAALYFNMAACEEHLDHPQAAALLLRQYLIESPRADDRGAVEKRVDELERREAEERRRRLEPVPVPLATPAPAVAPPPAPEPRPITRLRYTWAALGVTAAAGIAAIGTGAYTAMRHGDLKRSCGDTPGGCSAGAIDGLHQSALATDVLIGITAAAAVATVVLGLVEARRGPARDPSRRARVDVTPLGVRF